MAPIKAYARDLSVMESLALVPRAVNFTAAKAWITEHPWVST